MRLLSLTKKLTWCKQKHFRGLFKLSSRMVHAHVWPAAEVRTTFLEYFTSHDHLLVPSSCVVPRQHEGSYFVNAGMNQFKPIFLGTVDPASEMASYRRVTNSQKCIRVGGKHNDLEDVGRDSYHHTFFEMLGSWSFGDYFKKDACRLAWSLLTDVYRLSPDRLYVTYFGGDEAMGVEPDLECREIWRKLGVKESRILPCGTSDNFWDMGETGPCGPCTEIHYDTQGRQDATELVNTGDPSVIELWNLVFMQFDRQADGSLLRLPCHHVDTGMGLERVTAVLQGKSSNYDTDLFTPIFSAIQSLSDCPPYGGCYGNTDTSGTDTAYRIVADHIRMVTVAMGDGLRPGRTGIDSKLRTVLDRCIHQSSHVLKFPRGRLSQLVPVVTDSLGCAFPEMRTGVEQMQAVLDEAEDRYLSLYKSGTKLVRRLVETDRDGQACLPAGSLLDLQDGRWGVSIPADMSRTIAAEMGVTRVDLEGFESHMEQRKEKQRTSQARVDPHFLAGNKLDQQDVSHLEMRGVSRTRDLYKYSYSWSESTGDSVQDFKEPCSVQAIRSSKSFEQTAREGDFCGLVLDRTPFYSEAGGQAADTGEWSNQDCVFKVVDVQQTQGYVLHTGHVVMGTIAEGDSLVPRTNLSARSRLAVNHTATHLVNFALNQVLGGVVQQGSSVTENKLVFDFTCNKTKVKAGDLRKITDTVREIIRCRLPVYTEVVPLPEARNIPGLRMLPTEVYPGVVRVLSVGAPVGDLRDSDKGRTHSVELCGGSHVDHTGRLGDLVVTHFQGMQQGTKRVTAITGSAATQARENVVVLNNELDKLEQSMKSGGTEDTWMESQHRIESMLTGTEALILPKLERDEIVSRIDLLKTKGLNKQKNKQQLLPYVKELNSLLERSENAKFVVATLEGSPLLKQMVSVIDACNPPVPTTLLARKAKPEKARVNQSIVEGKVFTVVAFVPEAENSELSSRSWIEESCQNCGAKIMSSSQSVKSSVDIFAATLSIEGSCGIDELQKSLEDYFTSILKLPMK